MEFMCFKGQSEKTTPHARPPKFDIHGTCGLTVVNNKVSPSIDLGADYNINSLKRLEYIERLVMFLVVLARLGCLVELEDVSITSFRVCNTGSQSGTIGDQASSHYFHFRHRGEF